MSESRRGPKIYMDKFKASLSGTDLLLSKTTILIDCGTKQRMHALKHKYLEIYDISITTLLNT